MKKTILTIMVAAMMLVAFTACQENPDFLGYNPTMVTLEQNSTIVTGQTVTPDMFTATVTYANGKTAVADGIVEITEEGKALASITKGASETLTASLTPVITPIQSVSVSGETQDVEVNGSPAFDKLTIVASYDGGTYTYTAVDTSVSARASYAAALDLSSVGEVVVEPKNVVVEIDGESVTVSAVNWTINVVNSDDHGDIASLVLGLVRYEDTEAVAIDTDEVFIGDVVGTADGNIGLAVYAKYEDGTVAEEALESGYALNGDTFTAATKVAADKTYKIEAVYSSDYAVKGSISFSGKDYTSAINSTVTLANNKKDVDFQPTATQSKSLSVNDFVFTCTKASDTEKTDVSIASSNFEIDKTFIPAGTTTDFTVNFSMINEKGEKLTTSYTFDFAE